MKKHIHTAALMLCAAGAHAHDAWIEQRGDAYAVVHGHDGKAETYAPAKVVALAAVDARGGAIALKRRAGGDLVQFTAAAPPALVTVHFDNGYWARSAPDQPWLNLPMNAVPGATSGSHAVKYGKTIFAWQAVAMRPLGQPLEIVPAQASAPVAGKSLAVQVLWQGRPWAGATLVRMAGGKEQAIVADAQGRAEVPVAAGQQMLVVNREEALKTDPRADRRAIAANLVFTAP